MLRMLFICYDQVRLKPLSELAWTEFCNFFMDMYCLLLTDDAPSTFINTFLTITSSNFCSCLQRLHFMKFSEVKMILLGLNFFQ